MRDENPRGFVALGTEEIDAEGRQWVEVLPTADKVRNGPFYMTITAADLEVWAESIRANAGKIPVDYDHGGARKDKSTRAAGWFTGEAEVRDVEGEARLYGQVQWTPKALEEIRGGEFKFVSAEMTFEKRDSKSGLLTKADELVAATLTNRPFFQDLAPVAADLAWDSHAGFEWLKGEVFEALNPLGLEDPAYCCIDIALSQDRAIIKDWSSTDAWIVPFTVGADGEVTVSPSSEWVEVEEAWVAEVETTTAANLARRPQKPVVEDNLEGEDMATDYLKALGLDETAEDSVKIAKALNAKDEQIVAMQAEITDLKAEGEKTVKLNDRIAELEQRDRKRDVEQLVARGVDSGRILPSETDTLSELFVDNVNGLKTLLASRPAGFYGAYGRKELGLSGGHTMDDPDLVAVARSMGIKADDDYQLEEEGARLHVRAEKLLAERGKPRGSYTSEEYSAAISEVLVAPL